MSARVLAAALGYAHRGIPVFPVNPLNKHPYCARGFHAATTDEMRIEAWWQQLPDSMIGMPTGPVSKLWVLDVDIDVSKRIYGTLTLHELTTKHGPLMTRAAATPRGGAQYFFHWNNGVDIRNSASRIGEGLDVRGDGGYVVLPPSMRADGTPYRWLNTLPLADAPLWLIAEALRSSCGQVRDEQRTIVLGGPCNGTPSPRIRAWAVAALRSACERIAVAGEGTRNGVLNAEGFDVFRLVAGGYLAEEQVRASLLQAADDCGLIDDDGTSSVLNTINSAAAAGLAQPRFYRGR